MKDNLRRRYETLLAVRDFGTEHAASFPATSRGHELFTALGVVITEIEQHAAAQGSGEPGHTRGNDQSGRSAHGFTRRHGGHP